MNGGYLVNSISVAVFGMILSGAFCDIYWTRKKRMVFIGSMAAILLFQGIIYFWVDAGIVKNIYPFITHIPFIVTLYILSKRYLWPVISVLTAYFCCQLRRWLALLTVAICSGGLGTQNIAELALTLPLLWILLKWIAPSVRSISHDTISHQWQFGLAPALYYCFDYLMCIYTNLFWEGSLVAVEFMPFAFSVAYLMFVLRASSEKRIRDQLEQTQKIMNIQIAQAIREIEDLREAQKKARTYRHDLRHHMQYLFACIENGKLKQAQEYIQDICSEIEMNKMITYCENEAANLIFSSFFGRASGEGIPIRIRAAIPQSIHVSESDLCVLLSNALENALYACLKIKGKGISVMIDVLAYEKGDKLFFQFLNSCDGDVVLERGIPVTDIPGHGFGVYSICAVVEKYGGIYDFSMEEGTFILRVSF